MTHPDIEQLNYGELLQEARLCGRLLENCKRRANNPHNITEFVKAREDMPIIRDHMARVTRVCMDHITLRN
jgi:hypothetical protein